MYKKDTCKATGMVQSCWAYCSRKGRRNFNNLASLWSGHTDYGRQMKSFFIEISNTLGIWGILGRFISTHFGTVSPLSMICISQPLFLKK